jgi:chromosome segregation ATPase
MSASGDIYDPEPGNISSVKLSGTVLAGSLWIVADLRLQRYTSRRQRTMADAPDNPPPAETSQEEMHWAISYLRQDMQDLRATTARELEAMRAMFARLEARFEDRFARVDERFDKMDEKFDKVDERFDEVYRLIREQGDRLTQRMMMLVGLSTTIIVAAIKL